MADDVLHLIEDGPTDMRPAAVAPWTIAIIDDNAAVHEGTRFALYDYTLNGRPLRFLSAFSAREGRELLRREPDVAVVLLDVVMESDKAGLELVDFIRKDLRNETVRIVLRTGQPGQAPERRIILDYDINDYKAKTELTADKLFTTLTAALRSYQQLQNLTDTRRGLEHIIEAASGLFGLTSASLLSQAVLKQLGALLGAEASDGILVLRRGEDTVVLAGTGRHSGAEGLSLSSLVDPAHMRLLSVLERGRYELDAMPLGLCIRTAAGVDVALSFDIGRDLTEVDRKLVELFASRLPVAFDNVLLHEALNDANARLEERVIARTAELTSANEKLAAQRAMLRRANEFKNEMLGKVAHDLKNPLGVILGRAEILTDLLADAPVPVDLIREQAGHIRTTARKLTGMVDELIVDAMNDAVDIAIRYEPLDLSALAAEVVSANAPLAEQKGQTIRLEATNALVLKGDQERLREAIDNLVGNAVKYSPMGAAIVVSVRIEDGEAVCCVIDQGPGLCPEDAGRVFGRFQRLSAKPTGGESSTGLGLSIVKRIAELHGGRAVAESDGPGRGSVFSLRLPVGQGER
jgi:signal transduction histidine kinase